MTPLRLCDLSAKFPDLHAASKWLEDLRWPSAERRSGRHQRCGTRSHTDRPRSSENRRRCPVESDEADVAEYHRLPDLRHVRRCSPAEMKRNIVSIYAERLYCEEKLLPATAVSLHEPSISVERADSSSTRRPSHLG